MLTEKLTINISFAQNDNNLKDDSKKNLRYKTEVFF